MSYITPKEKEVLSLLAQGLSTKEIAGTLAISYHTVESHRKNLRLKFEAKNSSELMMKVSQWMGSKDQGDPFTLAA
jgi:DNA-binding CsgD family transcriptional regulator